MQEVSRVFIYIEREFDKMMMSESNLVNPSMAHVLYLTNISFAPILSFFYLLHLYNKIKDKNNKLLISHYRQSILANVVAGLLLAIVSSLILIFGDFNSAYTWMWLILYVTCVHSILIVFGVFALMKANNDQYYTYPIFGNLWP